MYIGSTAGTTLLEKLRSPTTSTKAPDDTGGTAMLGLFAFAAVVLVLLAILGLPYQQSWYGRWGNSDR
jgi:hypothetical protein